MNKHFAIGLALFATVAAGCAVTAGEEFDEAVGDSQADELTSACGKAAILNGTPNTRLGIMTRGFDWVDRHVMYSQTPQSKYDGYRTDCSGFVSMAWDKPAPGNTTSTFYTVEHPIGWDALIPGDALVRPGHHIMLFAGWLNKAHTEFCTLEEYNWGHPASVLHHYTSSYKGTYTPVRVDDMPHQKCFSPRLEKDVIDGACVQQPDNDWRQCADGVWIDGKAKAGPCTAEHPS